MRAAGDARVKVHVIQHHSVEVVSCYILVVRVRSVLRLKGANMGKEAHIVRCVLATEPLLVRIDRNAYAPQMRRIADLQSWLVGPGGCCTLTCTEREGRKRNRQLCAHSSLFLAFHVI